MKDAGRCSGTHSLLGERRSVSVRSKYSSSKLPGLSSVKSRRSLGHGYMETETINSTRHSAVFFEIRECEKQVQEHFVLLDSHRRCFGGEG